MFEGLNFDLHPGETLFLTGPSGAGKSTALAVLAGLLAPSAGTLEMRGVAMAQWPEADLRAHLTMVAQRSQLIGGMVAENLALALPQGKLLPEDEARAALHAVDLDEVIEARGGFAALLGEVRGRAFGRSGQAFSSGAGRFAPPGNLAA